MRSVCSMARHERFVTYAFSLFLGLSNSSFISAQEPTAADLPARVFSSAEEHYNYLLEQADGGTQHTVATLPNWSGMWLGQSDLSSLPHPTDAPLTPDFRAHYDELQRQMADDGEVDYDRTTHCEPTGYPRWIFPTGTFREFVLTPTQSWFMLEFMNETRRVYTDDRPHDTPEGNTWLGDSIGFWDGDKLVIWTLAVKAADYKRGQPETSSELQGVETWQLVEGGEGQPVRIMVEATTYDPVGLTQPWNVSAAFDRVDFDYRIRYWECAGTNDAIRADDGSTTTILPSRVDER